MLVICCYFRNPRSVRRRAIWFKKMENFRWTLTSAFSTDINPLNTAVTNARPEKELKWNLGLWTTGRWTLLLTDSIISKPKEASTASNTKVRLKRLDPEFLEFGALRMYLQWGNPEFLGILSFETHFKIRVAHRVFLQNLVDGRGEPSGPLLRYRKFGILSRSLVMT